jgi:uncharacterized membrane protein (DUF485 family)
MAADRPDPHGVPAPYDGPLLGRSARVGLSLFGIYLAIYALFVYLAAFRPDVMAHKMANGVNVAIAYGMALIFVAIAFALLYAWLCGRADRAAEQVGDDI